MATTTYTTDVRSIGDMRAAGDSYHALVRDNASGEALLWVEIDDAGIATINGSGDAVPYEDDEDDTAPDVEAWIAAYDANNA